MTPAPTMAARRPDMRRCFNLHPPVGGGREVVGTSLPVERLPLFRGTQRTHKVDFRTRVDKREHTLIRSLTLTVHGHLTVTSQEFALQTLRVSNKWADRKV
ncbi:hypothetical protein GCM10023084_11390 [Streptomyces lacrimifluminis]|uniref:Uncharacterized protein n=1 Tax=Streptomyces lacrimifluminis TaxID=1500077 RepID=A0A917KP01_9ACTN|nr:hypothetical protein GCM10012282_15370 [Streptomyces lacrimifluminis]